jgi:DNA-binding TFAR19-related protein (PDSD5 family)
MNDDEKELEKLKAKRFKEMQKNLSENKKLEESNSTKKQISTPREIILKRLGHRGLEVLEAAEFQYPNESTIIISK